MTAHEAKTLAERLEALERAETLAAVCTMVGIGVGDLQSGGRRPELVKHRAVVAWILADRLKWSAREVSRALHRTPRQVRRLLRGQT